MKNKSINPVSVCLSIFLLSSSTLSQAALVKFVYIGNPYSNIIDDPLLSGSYNPTQKMRGEFYVDESIADSASGFVKQFDYDQNAVTANIFGLRLFDGRVELNGTSHRLEYGSRISFTNGVVSDWNITLTTITNIEALLQGQQWISMLTNSSGDNSRIIECIENCSSTRTYNEVNVGDSASAYNSSASLSAFSASTVVEIPGQWVRDPSLYELTPDGSIIPQVPIPAAVWLFGSGLIGLIGVARRKKA